MDCMNACPLLSKRLNRFVRQNPTRRLPARERSICSAHQDVELELKEYNGRVGSFL